MKGVTIFNLLPILTVNFNGVQVGKKNRFSSVFLVAIISLALTACNSNPPAPVVNRLPAKTSTASATTQKNALTTRTSYKAGDWRPDTYTVKSGDTLFSIGLAFGYDYKDIASANNIPPPYMIRVGQTLQLASLKPSEQQATTAQTTTDGNVTTFALGDDATGTIATPAKPATPSIIAITDPKATREPYSDAAFNTPLPSAKVATISAPETPTASPAPPTADAQVTPSKPADAIDSSWAWPTKGKILSMFNQAGNKGIDIGGTRGQAIHAANAGKVIYSGSDLRGYGKLVIVKHNATFLSVYAHNSAIMVKEGQQVARGQKIAEMGDSDSPTVKLHFEIRRQGQSVDPVPYLGNN